MPKYENENSQVLIDMKFENEKLLKSNFDKENTIRLLTCENERLKLEFRELNQKFLGFKDTSLVTRATFSSPSKNY